MTACKLLIVDDDRDFAEGLAEYLVLCGHDVDVAFTGGDGIEAAGNKAYDAVLLDIGLPGPNGVEILLKIRQTTPKVRCFLATGYSADHIVAQGIEAGAIEIMTKPIDAEALSRRLAAVQGRESWMTVTSAGEESALHADEEPDAGRGPEEP